MCYFTDIAPNPELVDGYVKNTIIFNDISEEINILVPFSELAMLEIALALVAEKAVEVLFVVPVNCSSHNTSSTEATAPHA